LEWGTARQAEGDEAETQAGAAAKPEGPPPSDISDVSVAAERLRTLYGTRRNAARKTSDPRIEKGSRRAELQKIGMVQKKKQPSGSTLDI
jgi:hypothetical protein